MSIFIKIEGILGNSSDSNHLGWIEAERLDWGSSRLITSTTSTRGDRESSNTTISDLTFLKRMDKATAYLVIEALCGRGKTITIEMTKTGQGQGADTYIQYVLHNALLSNYQVRCKQKNNKRPLERISISFTKLEMRYIPYNEDGIAVAPISVGFDTAQNIKL